MIRDTIDFALGILRPLRPDDAEDLVRACNDPSIARWSGTSQSIPRRDSRSRIRRAFRTARSSLDMVRPRTRK